jgi:uncharacterized protein YmfQ (DUF2313 family)
MTLPPQSERVNEMTRKEHIKLAQQAFIDRGFWPNKIMWECWKDAWLAGALADRKARADAVTKERKPVPEFELIEKWEGE